MAEQKPFFSDKGVKWTFFNAVQVLYHLQKRRQNEEVKKGSGARLVCLTPHN